MGDGPPGKRVRHARHALTRRAGCAYHAAWAANPGLLTTNNVTQRVVTQLGERPGGFAGGRSRHARAKLPLLCAIMLVAGCTGQQPPPPREPPPRQAALRVVVAGDAVLARAVSRLRGAWQEAGGGELTVVETSADELVHAAANADVLLYPVRYQGLLAEQGLLDVLPAVQREAPDAAWNDIFESLRVKQLAWGDQTVAVPLGLPVYTCMYRAKVLEQQGLQPPQTWAELAALAATLRDRHTDAGDTAEPRHVVLLPLAEGWAGLTFLCHAAAYVRHRDQYSDLFDLDSLDPLVAGPPFVKALTELSALAGPGRDRNLQLTPTEAFQAICRGECVLTLGWPVPVSARGTSAPLEVPVDLQFAEAPGADAAFNRDTREWDARTPTESPHVTLLGAEGRLGSAIKGRPHSQAAWEFLLWLSGPRWSERVSTSSAAATLFREAHLRSPGPWIDELRPTAARSYAHVLQQSLTQRPVLLAPRLPGADRYLAALDRAVRAVVIGERKPREALRATAEEWKQITAELDIARQKRAYHASLGLLLEP